MTMFDYGKDIDCLVDNYMLTLNKEAYVYYYDFIGSSMMPDITAFPIR